MEKEAEKRGTKLKGCFKDLRVETHFDNYLYVFGEGIYLFAITPESRTKIHKYIPRRESPA